MCKQHSQSHSVNVQNSIQEEVSHLVLLVSSSSSDLCTNARKLRHKNNVILSPCFLFCLWRLGCKHAAKLKFPSLLLLANPNSFQTRVTQVLFQHKICHTPQWERRLPYDMLCRGARMRLHLLLVLSRYARVCTHKQEGGQYHFRE